MVFRVFSKPKVTIRTGCYGVRGGVVSLNTVFGNFARRRRHLADFIFKHVGKPKAAIRIGSYCVRANKITRKTVLDNVTRRWRDFGDLVVIQFSEP